MPEILRLFSPEEPPRRCWTLRDVYEQKAKPVQTQNSPSTHADYRTTLNHWERLSDNPPVDEIRSETLEEFRDAFLERTGCTTSTFRKYYACLRRLLKIAAARRLISSVPILLEVPSLSTTKIRRHVPDEHLNALYEACNVATWPDNRTPAPDLWRCAIVLAFNFGIRTHDLWWLEWEHVIDDPRHPNPNHHETNGYGWLRFLPTKTKRKKGELVLPLNAVARAHLEAIRWSRRRVFQPSKAVRLLRRERERIHQAAGLSAPYYGFQDLRKTCNIRYNRMAAENKQPPMGSHILGHSPRGVNEEFYSGPVAEMIAAVHALPQPAAFTKILETDSGRHSAAG